MNYESSCIRGIWCYLSLFFVLLTFGAPSVLCSSCFTGCFSHSSQTLPPYLSVLLTLVSSRAQTSDLFFFFSHSCPRGPYPVSWVFIPYICHWLLRLYPQPRTFFWIPELYLHSSWMSNMRCKSNMSKMTSWDTTRSCLSMRSSHSLPSSCSAQKPCRHPWLYFSHPHITSISKSCCPFLHNTSRIQFLLITFIAKPPCLSPTHLSLENCNKPLTGGCPCYHPLCRIFLAAWEIIWEH